VFFNVGTRCIPIGCEGPILRSGMSGTEVVSCYLVCMLLRVAIISTIRSPDVNHSFISLIFAASFVHLNQSFLVALISGAGSSCSASLAALSADSLP
jgi:hypothetical protein